jgi:hypothetical protein
MEMLVNKFSYSSPSCSSPWSSCILFISFRFYSFRFYVFLQFFKARSMRRDGERFGLRIAKRYRICVVIFHAECSLPGVTAPVIHPTLSIPKIGFAHVASPSRFWFQQATLFLLPCSSKLPFVRRVSYLGDYLSVPTSCPSSLSSKPFGVADAQVPA